jgi:minimal PKS ketosynthase (KS/KS alpha)
VRRSAVTGIGVVAPGGPTRDAFWDAITAGRTATRGITFFDPSGFRSQIAAEADFDPHEAGLTEHEVRRMDRYIQFAAAAGMEALTDSGLDLVASLVVLLGVRVAAIPADREHRDKGPAGEHRREREEQHGADHELSGLHRHRQRSRHRFPAQR